MDLMVVLVQLVLKDLLALLDPSDLRAHLAVLD